MGGVEDRGRYDWLVELGGAAAPSVAAGFAAFRFSPSAGPQPEIVSAAAGFAVFALAFLTMRAVRPEPRQHAMHSFAIEPLDAPSELLLEDVYEPSLSDEMRPFEDDVLLLDDALGPPDPDSRVVRLFEPRSMPTAGQLKDRIDRHLAAAPRPSLEIVPDASDALYQALAELRRSLR